MSDIEKVKARTCFEDVVQDMAMIKSQSPPPDLEWIWNKVCPPRHRSLYPIQPSMRMEDHGIVNNDRRLIITVISANNTPNRVEVVKPFVAPFLTSPSVRRGTETNLTQSRVVNDVSQKWKDTERDKIPLSLANYSLQIQFQGQVHQLSLNNNVSSSLKRVLEFPLKNGSTSFSPLWLKRVIEPIKITLFDQAELSIGSGGGYYEDEDATFEEPRFIGHIDILLSAIYEGGKIEGNIPFVEPSLIMGYEKIGTTRGTILDVERQDSGTVERADDGEEIRLNEAIRNPTSLNVLVSIDPPICLPTKHGLVSNDSLSFTMKAKSWMNDYSQYNLHCGKRYCNILITGPNGNQFLINQFLKKQRPPHGYDTMYRCAHYVSLIPFLQNWESLKKEIRVKTWSTSQLFLNVIAGDWEEHAALLANYFSYLGRDRSIAVFLVFGFSIAEGNVVSA